MFLGLLKIISISGNAVMCVSVRSGLSIIIQISVATLSKAEVGEITCNIFYFNIPKILSFQRVNNLIKPSEIFYVRFLMLSL